MKTSETMNARGNVIPAFVCPTTGEVIGWDDRHNTLSYDAAMAMAMAFGGDNSKIPNRIGIIYGSSGSAFDTISRDQSWSELYDELKTKNCDVQVQSFSCTPTLSKVEKSDSSSDTSESGWAITFHAHSDSVTEGSFGTSSGSGSSVPQIFTSGTYIYQAVLLNKQGSDYKVLARVSLANGSGSYYTKPTNFEVAIDWTVKFF